MQVRAVAGVVRAHRLLDQPPEVLAPRIVGGGQPGRQAGLAQALERRFRAVRDVLAGESHEVGRPVVGFALHDGVPDDALDPGRKRLERGEQRRHLCAGARRTEVCEQVRVEAGGPLVRRPGRGHAARQQQELVSPGPARVGAAGCVAGGERERLRREPACRRVVHRAQARVSEDRGPVPGAQFTQRRIRGRGVRAQQLGQPRVGRRAVSTVLGLGVTVAVAPVGPCHPPASSHPLALPPGMPETSHTYRRVWGVTIVMEGNPRGKR
ncbi:hypothetical protein [Streptomyces avermitilis]|uniref:hypothetical protein n=1 Tax=Streptomyces avermitilis TaxID=33903 RepID=UPI00280B7BDD|nr:hypothetical protein [Streptomyces avermitilis]